jgi:hypothetical protein
MPLARRLLLALALVCASAAHAQAALIIDFVLTPTGFFGNRPFGIAGLPAGPFTASFTLADPLPENFFGGLDVGDFAATVGDQSWDLGDLLGVADFDGVVSDILVRTDATGAITRLATTARDGSNTLTLSFIAPDQDFLQWAAFEGSCADPSESACVMGTASVSTRLVAEVAEPASLALVAAGLAAIAATRRRQPRIA